MVHIRIFTNKIGFTIIELLVSVAIIGVLIAVLLPAMQLARESARRGTCASNLKQIGLALHMYHDSHRVFPPGGITIGLEVNRPPHFTNWAISILPYLEQADIYNKYQHDQPNEHPNNRTVRETIVKAYLCPTDIAPDTLVIPAWGVAHDEGAYYARGSYRCVSGRSNGHPNWWDCQQVEWPDGRNPLSTDWRGPLHHVGTGGLGCESISTIVDGASNTLFVGERHVTEEYLERGTLWASTAVYYNMGTLVPENRTMLANYGRCLAVDSKRENECKRGWGSFHTAGAMNFLFCDGSVRGISRNADMELLCQMAAISDGQPSGSAR